MNWQQSIKDNSKDTVLFGGGLRVILQLEQYLFVDLHVIGADILHAQVEVIIMLTNEQYIKWPHDHDNHLGRFALT